MKNLINQIKKACNETVAHDIIRNFIKQKTHKEPERILQVTALDTEQDGADLEIVYRIGKRYYSIEILGGSITRHMEV